MALRVRLVWGLCLVTLLVTAIVLVTSVVGSYRTARLELRSTAERAAFQLERSVSLDAAWVDPLQPARGDLEIVPVMAPGTCLVYEAGLSPGRRLCAGWQIYGPIAPAWFREMLKSVFPPLAPEQRLGADLRGEKYLLSVSFDPVAAATRAWQQVKLIALHAGAVGALFIGFASVIVWDILRPVPPIVAALRRLSGGRLDTRVAPAGAREFRQIARAFNFMAEEMAQGVAARAELMEKLLEVEDSERRQLARELHDVLGQTLTATAALAATIEASAPTGGGDRIADDARAIGRNVKEMMATLRTAFARLRPPDLEVAGLEASIRTMLAGWSTYAGGRTAFEFDCRADLASIPAHTASNLYRIVQEGVTNAMRHATPSVVRVALSTRQDGDGRRHVLTVEDDGGGSPSAITEAPGLGVLGIRERVALIRGEFAAEPTAGGVRLVVAVPAQHPAEAA